MVDTFRVLSLGAGVQSSTLLFMMEKGEVEKADVAIFADTQAEPKVVYDWLEYIKKNTTIPIHVTTFNSLEVDAVTVKTSKQGRKYQKTTIPIYSRKENGKIAIHNRWCTLKYKIEPIHRKIRELIKDRGLSTKTTQVLQYIGISLDEESRAKESTKKYITNVFPLIDKKITRQDCIKWMLANNYPTPPKSSCIFCPYHSDEQWAELKKNKEEWHRIILFEKNLRAAYNQTVSIIPFLHDSCVPIDEVQLKVGHDASEEFVVECEGMCGV